ncbi:GNAT family N-acetyltransferase [Geomonas anaerohicana]|uniref:GNAT family N-acetyltransferase n=1 Tax=Geomonas anaerohicana TaxID=2798583 RepID=A0ABS0YBM6_9BACT|nr:GNAT family N-acetyltransferase [Geomonas anaerohicana]MBJ6749697.1 GNAT family N-acetyltransferase [Geomonas anaerohicana]
MTMHETLDWDTGFFGFKVARILPERLQSAQLQTALAELEREGVTLAYWACDPDDLGSQQAALQSGGFLADRKVTYCIDAATMRDRGIPPSGSSVERYVDEVTTPELEELALQAGVYSRFRIDPRMPREKFEELYRIWIRNSVNGRIADQVLVARDAGKIVGMVTVGRKGDRADIGLVAVDASMRGKKLGGALVHSAQQWALHNGFEVAQVVTQGDNLAACRLYEKWGYKVDSIRNIYHFWSCP